ncbi:tetratricopeptide repeat protein [Pontibacter arcticus]|uniref:Uncharacterized protein n=1 Tax=Pontibacter arcticus TaxID=2080288 RepID=A0A364RGF1_9BACT|nr:hypothetical protein [Pontibacter arcticus]RAU83420.1 hypothetical protein DP923_09480 [Pontibacter arcticus]
MKRLFSALLIIGLLFSGDFSSCLAAGNASGNERLMQRAEALLSSYKDSEALMLYEQVLDSAADNYEALCKASFLHCRIGERYLDETTKGKHFSKAKAYALRAYGINPLDAESNYVMAMAMGCEAMVAGPKKRLTAIYQMRSYLDIALAGNEQHAGAWYMLGRWYFKVANLNVAEQTAAKFFFGGVNEKATNQDAVAALEKAISYEPSNIRYYYDLACVYDEMKDKSACISTLEKALTVELETKEELELSRRCKIMLEQRMKS